MSHIYTKHYTDPPDWLANWAELHALTIEEMSNDGGWQLFTRDGTPHVHCYASWSMQVFLRSLINSPDYGVLQVQGFNGVVQRG